MLFNSVRPAFVVLLQFVFFINCKSEYRIIKDFDKLFNRVCRATSESGNPCYLLECNGQVLSGYQNNVFEQIHIHQRFGCESYSAILIERMTVTLAKPTYLVVHEDVRTKMIVISEIVNMTSLRIEIKPATEEFRVIKMFDLIVGNLDSFASMEGLKTIQFVFNYHLEAVNGCAGAEFRDMILRGNIRLNDLDLTACRITSVVTEDNRIEKLTARMFPATLNSVEITNENYLKTVHTGAFTSKRLDRLKIHKTYVETVERSAITTETVLNDVELSFRHNATLEDSSLQPILTSKAKGIKKMAVTVHPVYQEQYRFSEAEISCFAKFDSDFCNSIDGNGAGWEITVKPKCKEFEDLKINGKCNATIKFEQYNPAVDAPYPNDLPTQSPQLVTTTAYTDGPTHSTDTTTDTEKPTPPSDTTTDTEKPTPPSDTTTDTEKPTPPSDTTTDTEKPAPPSDTTSDTQKPTPPAAVNTSPQPKPESRWKWGTFLAVVLPCLFVAIIASGIECWMNNRRGERHNENEPSVVFTKTGENSSASVNTLQ